MSPNDADPDPNHRPPGRWVLGISLLALLVASFAVRVAHPSYQVEADGVYLHDTDTVRRLVRLHHLDAHPEPYPSPNLRDGAPGGYVIHWTLPMDWVIRALDAVAPSLYAGARPYESGAAWSGPLLCTLSVLAFALHHSSNAWPSGSLNMPMTRSFLNPSKVV